MVSVKVLFVEHEFRKFTKSTTFLEELLRRHFEVEVRYLAPEPYEAGSVEFETDADLVVIVQMDFLASHFLEAGIPTVIAPMFDASGNLPEGHWESVGDASFLAFSFALHSQFRSAGNESLLVKYYPPPQVSAVDDFEQIRAYLWQRRPDSGLHWMYVNHMLGEQMDNLHIHRAPDDSAFDGPQFDLRGELPFSITTSKWSKEATEAAAHASKANVYISPRHTEGIGLGFLEAMARGQIVIAPDSATHNEYIAHSINGFLSDGSRLNLPERGALRLIAQSALDSCRIGHERWLESEPRLVSFLERSASSPPQRPKLRSLDRAALSRAYFDGRELYEQALSVALGKEVSWVENAFPTIHVGVPLPLGSTGPELARRWGWDTVEEAHTWISGLEGVIGFVLGEGVDIDSDHYLEIVARTLPLVNDAGGSNVFLNGVLLGTIEFGYDFESSRFTLPKGMLRSGMPVEIRIVSQGTEMVPDREHALSVAVRSVRLAAGQVDADGPELPRGPEQIDKTLRWSTAKKV